MKVLIIGGYGTFGYRIAERLSNEMDLHIVLAGRSIEKARKACAQLNQKAAKYSALELDRTRPLAPQIDVTPDIIVDASGPFQAYDRHAELTPYEVFPILKYALEARCDYLDISDDGAFTHDIISSEMNLEADRAKINIVSGLSTAPVLSAIGLRQVEARIGPATNVTIGIAPSPKADLGRNVVAAVANYAGQTKVAVRRDGTRQTVAGLTKTRRETICVPGEIPLPSLSFAVADAPDSWVLADDFPALRNIWTGAGTRPGWLQGCLVLMSRLLANLPFGSLSPFAGLFHRVRSLFPFGDHRGGLFVRGSNASGTASWHLMAIGDDGPMIPALPAVAYIRSELKARQAFKARFENSHRDPAYPKGGAFAGHEVINLADLASEFDKLKVSFGLQYDSADLPIYEAAMGDAYARLYPAVAALHRTGTGRTFRGTCEITRGRNPLSHLVAGLFRFPRAGQNVPVTLEITPEGDGERWMRTFGKRRMSSHHSPGRGRKSRLIVERFGPFAIHMAILEDQGNMRIETRGWSCFGIPMPKTLKPGGDVYETQSDGRFVFHVDLQAPLIGRLVKYVGWLEPT